MAITRNKSDIRKSFEAVGLIWMDHNMGQYNDDTSNSGALNQTVLIVVCALLATLVLLLLATFFFKTRSLNRRVEALSQTRFGSQDSGLNRVNMTVPNTNQHALEGSNPVWNEDIQSDNISQGSGDSDLVGIEDNPEFKPQDLPKSNGIQRSSEKPNFTRDGSLDESIMQDVNENDLNNQNFSFAVAQPSSPTTEL